MLEQQDKDWIDARYVRKDDCQDIQKDYDKKFSNDDTRIKLFEQQLGLWNKLFCVIATATVGQLLASIFELLKG